MRDAIVGAAVGAPYSSAVVAEGRFVFVAGQGPLHDGVYVPGSIEDETRQTLENMGTLLERAGSGFEHVVRCGVWLVDLDDFPGMNGVYETFFPEPRPARATVEPTWSSAGSISTASRACPSRWRGRRRCRSTHRSRTSSPRSRASR